MKKFIRRKTKKENKEVNQGPFSATNKDFYPARIHSNYWLRPEFASEGHQRRRMP